MAAPTGPGRRERRRRETLEEIRRRAAQVVATRGADALTLRGLAADLGMAATGVHYYFSSRDDLLLSLIVEGFDGLAAAVAGAGREGPADGAWRAGARAYVGWAHANPELFQLLHSSTATRLKGRPGLLDAKDRAVRALTAPLLDGVASGELVAPDVDGAMSPPLRRHLRAWAQAAAITVSPHLQLAAVHAYTVVHGHAVLVVTGSLPKELLGDGALLEAHLELVLQAWRRDGA